MFNTRFLRIDAANYEVWNRSDVSKLGTVTHAHAAWVARTSDGREHAETTRTDAAAWLASHTFTTHCDIVATH